MKRKNVKGTSNSGKTDAVKLDASVLRVRIMRRCNTMLRNESDGTDAVAAKLSLVD